MCRGDHLFLWQVISSAIILRLVSRAGLKCQFSHGELLNWGKIRCFSGLIACQDARCRHPFRSCDRHRGPTSTAGRTPFRCCRIGAGQASTADPQSRPQACAQPARRGSYHRRFVHPFHAPGTRSPFRHRSEAFHSAASPQRAEETKVPHVVFAPARASAWPEGPNKELIDAVVEMKRRNPSWGCPRIAQQIALAFGVEIDKDMVRRILSVHYRPESVREVHPGSRFSAT